MPRRNSEDLNLGRERDRRTGQLRPASITPRTALNDMIETSDRHEAIENAEPADPIEPIERTEPTEPIDRTERLHPIDSSESWDHSDHLELPADRCI
jgi:hypothetical protein